VSGEIVRTQSGISLTVRAGADGADTVSGAEADLDDLVQRSAESIYRMTQLYRYGVYLANHGRAAEAKVAYSAQIYTGSAADRAWNYVGWALDSLDSEGMERGLELQRQAIALAPGNLLAVRNLGFIHTFQSRPELALQDWNRSLSLLSRGVEDTVRADLIPLITKNTRAEVDMLIGAFADASAEQSEVVAGRLSGGINPSADLARAFAGAHDLTAARAALVDPPPAGGSAPGEAMFSLFYAGLLVTAEAGNWPGVISQAQAAEAIYGQYPGMRSLHAIRVSPLVSLARAELGNFTAAEAQIAGTPADCYDCLLARAHIAELQGQHGRSDYWFAQAARSAPSIPFAYSDWGAALLARGDTDGAIAKFTTANQIGPHFANPLEGWGEALMAKNQSHLALAKFAEAEKYAPNWGRLHLKWGEALVYAGKKDQAQAQFTRAGQLDLTAAEKAELARQI
jgi:tetratricopeptide (TPR) repeat protein